MFKFKVYLPNEFIILNNNVMPDIKKYTYILEFFFFHFVILSMNVNITYIVQVGSDEQLFSFYQK